MSRASQTENGGRAQKPSGTLEGTLRFSSRSDKNCVARAAHRSADSLVRKRRLIERQPADSAVRAPVYTELRSAESAFREGQGARTALSARCGSIRRRLRNAADSAVRAPVYSVVIRT